VLRAAGENSAGGQGEHGGAQCEARQCEPQAAGTKFIAQAIHHRLAPVDHHCFRKSACLVKAHALNPPMARKMLAAVVVAPGWRQLSLDRLFFNRRASALMAWKNAARRATPKVTACAPAQINVRRSAPPTILCSHYALRAG
jgi:hypothetical protein